jgi:hypothetical protein
MMFWMTGLQARRRLYLEQKLDIDAIPKRFEKTLSKPAHYDAGASSSTSMICNAYINI